MSLTVLSQPQILNFQFPEGRVFLCVDCFVSTPGPGPVLTAPQEPLPTDWIMVDLYRLQAQAIPLRYTAVMGTMKTETYKKKKTKAINNSECVTIRKVIKSKEMKKFLSNDNHRAHGAWWLASVT